MKKVKLSDVAAAAGVSPTTVSRVLNNSGYVAKEKRILVENALWELGYLRCPSGAGVDRERLIGILFRRSANNMYFEKMGQAILAAAEKKNFSTVTLYSGEMDQQLLEERIEKLQEYKVCGIVIGGMEAEKFTGEMRRYLKDCKIPVIFVERTAESHGFNNILVDNRYGGYLATKLLIDHGRRQLLYITRKTKNPVEGDRLQGFLEAIAEAKEEGKNICHMVKYCNDDSVQSGYLAMADVYGENSKITGVFTWSDGYAAGVMQYLYDNKIQVPESMEVVGYDDTYSGYLAPPVSSVRMPYEEIGETVVSMVLNDQNCEEKSARTVTLEPKLVIRCK